MRVSQRESEDSVSPFPSDALEHLLRRAAAFLLALTLGGFGPKIEAERSEFSPIGETAGAVWHMLSDGGPTTLALLIEAAGVPESLFFMPSGGLPGKTKSQSSPATAITRFG